jgi:hypothetical protein
MLIHLVNPEAEGRNGEETGARTASKKFANMKANFVFTGFYPQSTYDRVIELAVRTKPPFCDPRGRGLNSHDFDTQTLGWMPARDIDSMDGYSAGHLPSCPLGSAA